MRTSGPSERWSRRSAPGALPGGLVDGGFGLRVEKGLESGGEFSPVGVGPSDGGSCTCYGRLPWSLLHLAERIRFRARWQNAVS